MLRHHQRTRFKPHQITMQLVKLLISGRSLKTRSGLFVLAMKKHLEERLWNWRYRLRTFWMAGSNRIVFGKGTRKAQTTGLKERFLQIRIVSSSYCPILFQRTRTHRYQDQVSASR